MKKLIEKLILYLDNFFYGNTKINLSKILNTIEVDGYEIRTDKGWSKFHELHKTKSYQVYQIELENGYIIECADTHLFVSINYELKSAYKLNKTDYLLVKDYGYIKVKDISLLNKWMCMYDISLSDNRYLYYTNDILSHNTTTTSIFLLHRLIFNADQNILVAANTLQKAEENLTMIKQLYRELPFFLKPGVLTYNQKIFMLDNRSRISIQATRKNTGVGSSYQIVYIDEFSVIEPPEAKNSIHARLLPALSSFNNSLLIYSTTPRGKDIFYDLYKGAEHLGHPIDGGGTGTNGFTAYTSFWYQIPGRNDVIIRYDNKYILNKSIILKNIIDYFIDNNFIINKIKFSDDKFWDIHLLFKPEKCTVDIIKRLKFEDGRNIRDYAIVTDWIELQREQIPDKDLFEQEFNLVFNTDDKGLFDGNFISYFTSRSCNFYNYKIKLLEKLLGEDFDYTDLLWIDKPEIFKIDLGHYEYGIEDNPKFEIEPDGYYLISVDLADGLGNDYSVINIFKITHFDKERITNMVYHDSKLEFYEFLSLHQVGIYRYNKIDLLNLAKILYHITYDILNSNNVKILIEANKGCGELLAHMKNLYRDKSKFDQYNIIKTFHKESDKTPRPGLLVTQLNRSFLIANFKKLMISERIVVYDKQTINEISHFTKRMKRDGTYRFEAEKGHNDDIVMSMVIMSSLFTNRDFKIFLMDYYDNMPKDITDIIERKIEEYDSNIPEDDSDSGYISISSINVNNNGGSYTSSINPTQNYINPNSTDLRKLMGL